MAKLAYQNQTMYRLAMGAFYYYSKSRDGGVNKQFGQHIDAYEQLWKHNTISIEEMKRHEDLLNTNPNIYGIHNHKLRTPHRSATSR